MPRLFDGSCPGKITTYLFKRFFSIISDLCVEAEFRAQVPNEIHRSGFSWAWPLTEPMCSVYSAVSGEALAVVDDYEGKTAKEVKRSLAAQVGVSRFRQRLWTEDWSHEIQDDEVFTSDLVKVQLVVLDFLPPEAEEDRRMIAALWTFLHLN